MRSSYLILRPIIGRLDRFNMIVQRNLDRAYMNLSSKDYTASMILCSSIASIAVLILLATGLTLSIEPLSSISYILAGSVAKLLLYSIGLYDSLSYSYNDMDANSVRSYIHHHVSIPGIPIERTL